MIVSWERCREGTLLCLENAEGLLIDAVLLYVNKRYTSSSSLAIYSFEEIGKGKELLELYQNTKNLSKSHWKKLSKGQAHTRKITTGQKVAYRYLIDRSILPENKDPSPDKIKEFEEAFPILAQHYQRRKEQYLYVGFDKNEWTSPKRNFSERSNVILASQIIDQVYGACIALAHELGLDSNLEKEYKEFGDLSMSRLMEVIDLEG